MIGQCRELGITFALDDSRHRLLVAYVSQAPASVLKIDQSFVRDMLDDPDDLAILEGVVSLAATFRRNVIAEGVETVEHGNMLLQLGCELAQGYGIARPMAADALPSWVEKWQPNSGWKDVRTIDRDDLPLLFAGVEHRAWITAMEHYLDGQRDTPPPLDMSQCRFGQWLDHEEARHRQSGFPVHRATARAEVHRVAEVVQRTAQRWPAAPTGSELHALRDKLLNCLQSLARSSV